MDYRADREHAGSVVTIGADLEPIDVFVGPNLESELVFVIDQIDQETGHYDEGKTVLGCTSEAEAKELYLSNYSDGWKCGPITSMTMTQFKAWLRNPARTRTRASQAETVHEGVTWAAHTLDDGTSGFISSGGLVRKHLPAGSEVPKRAVAKRGQMIPARVEGQGKLKRILLVNGQHAPQHVGEKIGEISHTWTDIKVSVDPESDVVATGINPKGKTVTVYRDEFHMKGHALKAARVLEGLQKQDELFAQNQSNREKPELKEAADVTWLMQIQGTRPGSEADTKMVAHLFGKQISTFQLDEAGRVAIVIGDHHIQVRDPGTRQEIRRRVEHHEPLEDSTYWLKSYGATTLEGRHVIQAQDGVRLQFVGKEGVWHDHLVEDHELAAMLLERKAAAGHAGKLFNVSANEVREYVNSLDHHGFTSKDMRTLRANQLAIAEVQQIGACCADPREFKERVKQVAVKVSGVLGNKPSQALASYILPEIFNEWSP